MKYFTLLVSLCALVTIVVWVYNMNYQTRQVFSRLDALRAEVADEGEAIQVLRVEWAWLNSPERLKRMVTAYGENLKLIYLQGDHFSHADSVPFSQYPQTALSLENSWSAPNISTVVPEASPFLPPVPRPQRSIAVLEVRWGEQ